MFAPDLRQGALQQTLDYIVYKDTCSSLSFGVLITKKVLKYWILLKMPKKLFSFVNDTKLECLPLTYGREPLSALQQTFDFIVYKEIALAYFSRV